MNDIAPAEASTTVAAPPERVWGAFTDPDVVPRFIPVKSVASQWRAGSPILWTTDFAHGRVREMSGTVLTADPPRLLAYEYLNPITKNTLRVNITLSPHAAGTRVDVVEQGHGSEVERAHGQGGWRLALANLKALLE